MGETEVTDLGWAAPSMLSKARHYFRADWSSLCRKATLPTTPYEAPVLGSVPRECTTCRRRLDKEGVH